MAIELKIEYNIYCALRSFVVIRSGMHDFPPTSMQAKAIACASKFTLSLHFNVLKRTINDYRALRIIRR